MKNQKTIRDMKDHLTNYEIATLDFRVDQWIHRNGILSNEINAYKALLEISEHRNDGFGNQLQEEIQRRRSFLNELMRDL